ncbi:MAG: preprotein translocase subunit YajC [Clostridia bacterium]|nr:preprotein translocase subunit YajC [Clostridia bacterium]
MIALIVVVFYFMYRSNKKQEREATKMRDGLEVGDEITTIGGIVGEIVSIKEDTIVIETSKAGTKIRFLKTAVRSVDVSAAMKRGEVTPAASNEKSSGKIEQAEIVEDKKPENKKAENKKAEDNKPEDNKPEDNKPEEITEKEEK